MQGKGVVLITKETTFAIFVVGCFKKQQLIAVCHCAVYVLCG